MSLPVAIDSNLSNPYVNLLTNSNNPGATIDNFGNVILPASTIPNNIRRLSPSWGQNVPKNVTINVPYRIQPLGIVPAPGSRRLLQNGSQKGNNNNGSVLLCALIPLLGEQRDIAKHQKIKLQRVRAIQSRKRTILGKSWWFSDSKQRKLKRLQRQPLLKTKKQEVYEKWEKRDFRREFKKRRQRPMMDLYISDDDNLPLSRGRSESPFECPVWCCKRVRRSRREEYDENKFSARARLRKGQSSRLSCLSDKSRSPITIRSSPSFHLFKM